MNQHTIRLWLEDIPFQSSAETPLDVARHELSCSGLAASLVPDAGLERDAYEITAADGTVTIRGGSTGILYGTYRYLMASRSGSPLPDGIQKPMYPDRMINCWDNMNGVIERGYSGPSLWFRDGRLEYSAELLQKLARLLASCGLNVLCLNNVNVHQPAQHLITDMLGDLARFADLFRPYGIRIMVSVDFSQPIADIGTADPVAPEVLSWWSEVCDHVYAAIPDLYGFLVKADSEHRPGPNAYGRTHAEGANMLARALKKHGGTLVWRCFVYNCQQDWRDTATDRPRAAWEIYQPLDGTFDDNVILQIKHGPYDFQVREPVSPLLLTLKKTRLCMELQLAQEYTGQQKDLYFMPPMWQELFTIVPASNLCAMAAVSNLGAEDCMTGHPFASANLFSYGLLAWDTSISPEACARLWIRLTYHFVEEDENRLSTILLESRSAYEKYTTPLALGWMVEPGIHYGPSPEGYEYQAWGTYHRANRDYVGIDRSSHGTGYAQQYPAPLNDLYEHPETCPENLLLFFHRLPYTYLMKDDRTLIQRYYDDHFEGYAWVEHAKEILNDLPFPADHRAIILAKIDQQLANAREWRDIVNTYFHRLSGIDDCQHRKIYD